ncbi:hypothetical protein [Streptomyces antibioticus]|uniref:hypothetical protein n=1 Tax=Streptomyces antibioticus TaxID=1890 RepID=UPI00340ECA99
MFGDGSRITGVVECWDDIFQFRSDEAVFSDEGWRVKKAQIDQVRDGDHPGELTISFRPPSPFSYIAVKPRMHEDKWRALAG